MTRYTVTWVQSALDELTELWLAVENKQALSAAANAIDAALGLDPSAKGSPESDALRSLTIAPLRVLYAVRELDRVVEVLTVQLVTPSSGVLGNGFAHPPH